ncbi:ArsR/SmtB family transcription factor [Risungbinella massiliensis]|uniref:ArsR/SmtB family transcription factor n=1 Tax=Risungbinella massiliensis TaxID=1329796 RepID=UPI0005CB9F48|nr:metalloregulator ArsR/SmtB family transcription factor [Risungbinella massiliensis]
MKKEDICEITCVEEGKVRMVKEKVEQENFQDTAQIFKALSDPTRLKIAFAILEAKELCVCDVANVLDSSIATASHHLRLLRNMGLAKYRKEGKMVYYSLDDEHVQQLVTLALVHQKEGKRDGEI